MANVYKINGKYYHCKNNKRSISSCGLCSFKASQCYNHSTGQGICIEAIRYSHVPTLNSYMESTNTIHKNDKVIDLGNTK